MTEDELARKIHQAFDYRGHVTLTLADGDRVTGFLYNRELDAQREPPFVELFLEGSGEPRRLQVSAIRDVAFSGKDHAE